MTLYSAEHIGTTEKYCVKSAMMGRNDDMTQAIYHEWWNEQWCVSTNTDIQDCIEIHEIYCKVNFIDEAGHSTPAFLISKCPRAWLQGKLFFEYIQSVLSKNKGKCIIILDTINI